MKSGDRVWRVGHISGPIAYPPRDILPVPRIGRFDDPRQEYRTLYVARYQRTALRESLQDLRRNAAAIARFKAVMGNAGLPPNKVPAQWRTTRVLAPARLRARSGLQFAYYEDPVLLRAFESQLAEELGRLGVAHLDISMTRSKQRTVSQRLGRFLYEEGFAGVTFKSNIPPGGTCVALFEGRARLAPAGTPLPLDKPNSALRAVCMEFDLRLV